MILGGYITDIIIMASVLVACYIFRVHNFRLISFSIITIVSMTVMVLDPSRAYWLVFQSAYFAAMVISIPSKSKKTCKILFYAALTFAALNFLMGMPYLYPINKFLYFSRNFIIYGLLATTIMDGLDNGARIFPYAFIGFWYIASDSMKLMFVNTPALVGDLFYIFDPIANHIFHIMLLGSVLLLSRGRLWISNRSRSMTT